MMQNNPPGLTRGQCLRTKQQRWRLGLLLTAGDLGTLEARSFLILITTGFFFWIRIKTAVKFSGNN